MTEGELRTTDYELQLQVIIYSQLESFHDLPDLQKKSDRIKMAGMVWNSDGKLGIVYKYNKKSNNAKI